MANPVLKMISELKQWGHGDDRYIALMLETKYQLDNLLTSIEGKYQYDKTVMYAVYEIRKKIEVADTNLAVLLQNASKKITTIIARSREASNPNDQEKILAEWQGIVGPQRTKVTVSYADAGVALDKLFDQLRGTPHPAGEEADIYEDPGYEAGLR